MHTHDEVNRTRTHTNDSVDDNKLNLSAIKQPKRKPSRHNVNRPESPGKEDSQLFRRDSSTLIIQQNNGIDIT